VEKSSTNEKFSEYLSIIRRLRKECPWDREQTHQSLRAHLIEECYEAVDAITRNDLTELKYELGDILLHVALQAIIAEEEDVFTIDDVLTESQEKLVRRHAHVFGQTAVDGIDDIKRNWENSKRSEGKDSVLDGVPQGLPGLIRAHRLQEKAAAVGFDWTEKEDVWKKVEEELHEFKKAERDGDAAATEREFGDVLFALVNYSRFAAVGPEFALQLSIDTFIARFRFVEEALKRRGKHPEESTLEEMNELWNEAKTKLT
jgi:MazG family protein